MSSTTCPHHQHISPTTLREQARKWASFPSTTTNRHNLPSPTPPNPTSRQCIYAHHNAEQLRGQEGKSARRGDGLRNYECFPFSQISYFHKVKTIIQKRKTYTHYRFKGSRPTTSFVKIPMRTPARTPATSSAGA